MAKKVIKLTEADLHRIVRESVGRILEADGDYRYKMATGLEDQFDVPDEDVDPYKADNLQDFDRSTRINRIGQRIAGNRSQSIAPQTDNRYAAGYYANNPSGKKHRGLKDMTNGKYGLKSFYKA